MSRKTKPKPKPEMHVCANCGQRYEEWKLAEIRHLWERVSPGEIMPSGQCPECGALCHPEKRAGGK